ncbi:SPOR domain-containing protein [Vibrio hippocampi]|uniref:SPOR domain-containing protein n=1 Tax=Vibrio hippocampi TaxID=654686 RepID=A0ABN8DC91_9VIBR|nr:SPOR domain-containing protein [Vibrio hippocampi]CAH0524320.1 hypothetical protein VHP8226_00134 [Vibrio hippocampi]
MSPIKSANKWLCSSFAIAASLLVLSEPSHAQDAPLCDATQVSSNQLPVLEAQCPIGQGVWSNNIPSTETSVYWIQCGLLDALMPLSTAKPLYRQISTHVWMKPEAKGYRCLLGPYTDSRVASRELAKVKTLRDYKDAFIRHISRASAHASPVKPVAAGETNITNSITPQISQENNRRTSTPKANTVVKVPATATTAQKPSPSKTSSQNSRPKQVEPVATLPTTVSSSVSIRFRAQVHNKQYTLPYLDSNNYQFYMEHNQAWNRLDYQTAIKVCSDLDMRLVNSTEWEALLASKVMTREQWPVQLPYWGDGQKGLFTSGKVVPVKANTQLNVLCVK